MRSRSVLVTEALELTKGSPGVLHGSLSYMLQDSDGQVLKPHSISPGCDCPCKPPCGIVARFACLHLGYILPPYLPTCWTRCVVGYQLQADD